jgi:hypothetical protein
VGGAHERLADTGSPRRSDDADAADPGVPSADGEVREPDRLAVRYATREPSRSKSNFSCIQAREASSMRIGTT